MHRTREEGQYALLHHIPAAFAYGHTGHPTGPLPDLPHRLHIAKLLLIRTPSAVRLPVTRLHHEDIRIARGGPIVVAINLLGDFTGWPLFAPQLIDRPFPTEHVQGHFF